jgi:hypothetical protein
MVGGYAGSDDYLHTGILPGHKNRQKLRWAQHRPLHHRHILLRSSDHRFCLTYIGICCGTLRGLRSYGALLRFFHFSRVAPHHWHSRESDLNDGAPGAESFLLLLISAATASPNFFWISFWDRNWDRNWGTEAGRQKLGTETGDRRDVHQFPFVENWKTSHLFRFTPVSPSCSPNLPCAETSEVQFDCVLQRSGYEGAVSNGVTTA